MNLRVTPSSIKKHICWWQQVLNAFLVGSGATFAILICLSNTFTASARVVWHDCHDNWLAVWMFMKENFSDEVLMVFAPFITLVVVFWSLNAFLFYLDFRHLPSWDQFKIQDGTNEVFDMDVLRHVFVVVVKNLLYSIPVAYLISQLMNPAVVCAVNLPTFNRVIFEVFICVLIEEPMFYYTHRLFHHRYFYGWIHKVHHEWTAPIGMIALYAHPIEHIFANQLPVLIGPLILGSHLSTICVWVAFAIFNAVVTHSGYHFPYLASNEPHDYHHLKFTENFGVLGVLDYLHGTDVNFRKSRQYKLHRTFFSDAYGKLRIRKDKSKNIDDVKL